ncbi:MAG: hypothetical protein K8J08_21090 [Thermoanaerobaculia bacterium]|nr:hypothetical protein [Thermoanaerobaculia bacterium]
MTTMVLDQETLRELIGSRVSLRGEEEIAVQISEVTALDSPATDAGRTPFSVIFVAEPGVADLPQGTYPLVWEEGESPLFLVPIGPGTEGRMRYEAIFN